MTISAAAFAATRLSEGAPFAVVTIAEAHGSTPREQGAAMAVSAIATGGTIGGGRLEWDAIEAARLMLSNGSKNRTIAIALGPSIGQCCGGRVVLSIEQGDRAVALRLADDERAREEARPRAFIYGAGHVGRALATALAPLPVLVTLIDERAEELARLADPRVRSLATERPATMAETAPPMSAHVVMTHSHALDSIIAATLLERGDFAYLGLIGSETKRALFLKAFDELGLPRERIDRVVCPIGGADVRDKRPEVIAALAAAEIVTALLGGGGGR